MTYSFTFIWTQDLSLYHVHSAYNTINAHKGQPYAWHTPKLWPYQFFCKNIKHGMGQKTSTYFIKHQAIEMYGWGEVWFHAFFTSVLEKAGWSESFPERRRATFIDGMRLPFGSCCQDKNFGWIDVWTQRRNNHVGWRPFRLETSGRAVLRARKATATR